MRADRTYLQRLAARASRRKNCLTDTTRTPWCRAILMRSRSRLRSSSRVTRCVALPLIAASRISSSSGSRQAFSSPEISTNVARAAISLTSLAASQCEYLNLRKRRGRLRTCASSVSCERDVTALNLSRLHELTTCPGGPEGLRKAETQTLVSSRATSGTAFSLDLGPSPSDFGLHDFMSDRFGTRFHPREQTLQVVSPAWLGIKRNQDTRFRFEPESPQRSQYAVFKHRMKRFFHPCDFFGQRHDLDYTGEFCAQQTDNSRSRYARGSGIAIPQSVIGVAASRLRPHRADDVNHRRLSILYYLERFAQHPG